MQTIKSLTAAFCAACIAGGVVVRLMPEGAAQRFIKAVAGLYILVSVLAVVKNVAPLELWPDQTASGGHPLPDYEAGVLQQSQRQLEQQYETVFLADGLAVELHIPLVSREGEARAGKILVQSAQRLTDPQQTRIRERLQGDLQPDAVEFQTEGNGP